MGDLWDWVTKCMGERKSNRSYEEMLPQLCYFRVTTQMEKTFSFRFLRCSNEDSQLTSTKAHSKKVCNIIKLKGRNANISNHKLITLQGTFDYCAKFKVTLLFFQHKSFFCTCVSKTFKPETSKFLMTESSKSIC